jgi:hypothetical protein
VHLLPRAGRGGQLEVPAGVGAAGAPPQGDPGAGQPQVGGVVVDGLEVVLDGGVDRGHAVHVPEVGQPEAGVHVELPLDLQVVPRHRYLLVPSSG